MKRMKTGLTGAVLLGLLNSCALSSDRVAGSPIIASPVIDANFPDPAVIKAPDGYYYA
jgi:hypothetical protein